MKLFCPLYVSPDLTKGEFKNVTIEETCITHKWKEKFLAIQFDMYYEKNDQKIIIGTKTMQFLGMEGDAISTNQTTIVRVDNPDYDPETNYIIQEPNPEWIEGEENLDAEGNSIPQFIEVDTTPPLKINIPLFKADGSLNVRSMDFEVVDFGYPTYEKALQMFNGGSFEEPEITISEPLTVGFIYSKLIINGEPVGKQFQLVQ